MSIQAAKDFLRQEFISCKEKNQRLTVRAFAKKTGVSPGRMSELLAGKRSLTMNLAHKISDGLHFSPEKKLNFLQLAAPSQTKGGKITQNEREYSLISLDQFHLIADWYHFALLNLIDTVDFISEEKWLAKRLGISTIEVRSALERLFRLELIESRAGRLKRTTGPLVTPYEVPSAALRKSHKQSLKQAIESLENDPIEVRNVTSITFPTKPEQIKKAKKTIQNFERRMARLLKSDDATEVYNLNVQLIPISRRN